MDPNQQLESIQQTQPNISATSQPTSHSTRLIVIVSIFVAILLSIIGGWYYFEIYQPARYAKAIIPIFEALEKEFQTPQNLKDRNDYQGAKKILESQQAFLQNKKNQLDKLTPPRNMQELHTDFSRALDLLIAANSDAQKITLFVENSNQLYDVLRPKDEPKDPTVGEFLQFWEDRIPKAKALASKLFQEKPPKADQLQFDKLKSTWQETEEGLQAYLSWLKTQDSNIQWRSVSPDTLSSQEKAKIAKVDKIDDFLPMLEDTAMEDANDLIKYTFSALASEEFNKIGTKVSNGIRELKDKYGQ